MKFPTSLFAFFLVTGIIHSIHAQGTFFGERYDIVSDSTIYSYPNHFDLVDIDHDGFTDIVFSSSFSEYRKVAWYPNNGDGTFGQYKVIEGDLNFIINKVISADLDGDGFTDILAYGFSQVEGYILSWYKNNGAGIFSDNQIITTQISYEANVQLGDLNDDGHMDIFVVEPNPNGHMAWFENDGMANFSDKVIISAYSCIVIEDPFIGDINMDGHTDIVMSCESQGIKWYAGNGTGTFSTGISINANIYGDIEFVDMDEDGDLDFLCSSDEDEIILQKNHGAGIFDNPIVLYSLPSNYLIVPFKMADIDGDSDLDIITELDPGNYDYASELVWIENTGNQIYGSPIYFDSAFYGPHNIKTGDLNNDGTLDIVAIARNKFEFSGKGEFVWYDDVGGTENFSQQFNQLQFTPENNQISIDWDSDGDMDILTWRGIRVHLFENDGTGNFSSIDLGTLHFETNIYYQLDEVRIEPVDMDEDGDMDIVLSYGKTVNWHENDGNNSFTSHTIENLDTPWGFDAMYVGDVDSDGDIDVICSEKDLIWYKNDGAQNFTPDIIYTIPNYYYQQFTQILSANIDAPSHKELVLRTKQNEVYWIKNWGNNVFGDILKYVGEVDDLNAIGIEDMDSDGDNDIYIQTNIVDNSGWFANDGVGNFGSLNSLPDYINQIEWYGSVQHHLSNADIDGDGDPDLISSVRDGILWYENMGNGNFPNHPILVVAIKESFHHLCADYDGNGTLDISTFIQTGTNSANTKNYMVWISNQYDQGLFVDQNASGSNDGSSWENAFLDLQDALAIAQDEDIIYIAEGNYLPTNDGKRGVYFDIPNGVTLVGGYNTGGTILDPSLYPTILSGDIDNDMSLDGNSFHVVTIKDVNDVKLENLTIQGGNADHPSSFSRSKGGGIFIKNATACLENIQFIGNRAIKGGGLYATNTSFVDIHHSHFEQNEAGNGAALYCSYGTEFSLHYSSVIDNTSTVRCAIEAYNTPYSQISHCLIANNESVYANAIGLTANTLDQTVDINHSTILGGNADKFLITMQTGQNYELDVMMVNNIIAHNDPDFNRNVIAFNPGILNFNHHHCYFQGSSVIGNGNNNYFSAIDGPLYFDAAYTPIPCAPTVNVGDNTSLDHDYYLEDLAGNQRFRHMNIDIGAFETQTECSTTLNPLSKFADDTTEESIQNKDASINEFVISPNPTNGLLYIDFELESNSTLEWRLTDILGRTIFYEKENSQKGMNHKTLDLHPLDTGIYWLSVYQANKITTYKVMKSSR